MLSQQFIYLGIFVNLFSGLAYILDTLRGKTKPNKVTWFLWSIAPFIAFAAEVGQHVGLASLFTFSVGLVPFAIFIASFINKKSYWQIQKFDMVCGVLSLMGLLLWWITKTGNVAIFFSIFSDFLAALPTVKKAYKEPETESGSAFLLGAIGAFIALLTIIHISFATFAYPFYIFIMNAFLALLIQGKLGKKLTKFTSKISPDNV